MQPLEVWKMNPIANKSVAIVGAGPGGLILARLLQMAGTRVRVYERDLSPTARVQGATLNINEEIRFEGDPARGDCWMLFEPPTAPGRRS